VKEIPLVYLENDSDDFVLWRGGKLTQGPVLLYVIPVNVTA
jgi:hypothetical protein